MGNLTSKSYADTWAVFTQFITTNLLIGRMLQLEGIPFVYLTGKNTSAEKLKAIDGFKGNSNIRYLVRRCPNSFQCIQTD